MTNTTQPSNPHFGWGSIARLGLIQACIGGVVVLATSTLNRILVVELGLAAVIPGLLVASHYVVQLLRPRMGFGADQSGWCTPWILGGMLLLSAGGWLAAWGTTLIPDGQASGLAVVSLGFLLIGVGVSACGTSVLTLLAKRTLPTRRAGAATLVWMMMIAGFAITAGTAGQLLDPFTPERLLQVAAGVTLLASALTAIALIGLETRLLPTAEQPQASRSEAPVPPVRFFSALREVLAEPATRQFTWFVAISMLAFSAQDLILEPFAGHVFGMTPGATTALSGLQHAGVLTGMLLVAAAGSGRIFGRRLGSLSFWTVSGCLVSGFALLGLTIGGQVGPGWPLKANVFLLGAANGAFSIASIASMMRLASEGAGAREGTRMGVWGAAQAIAFGLGGILGTSLSDIARWVVHDLGTAYGVVFLLEAVLFVVAAQLARSIREAPQAPIVPALRPPQEGEACHV
ncbi:MAG: BCD family MFS transporter [Burkholderiaceae bacterium]